jgi:DNA-binding ferritin-like protein
MTMNTGLNENQRSGVVEVLTTLLADHEATVRTLREGIEVAGAKHGDKGTEDFVTALLEQHEKRAKTRAASRYQ